MDIYDKGELDAIAEVRQADRDKRESKAQEARESNTPANICRRLSQMALNLVIPKKPSDDTEFKFNGQFKI